MERETFVGLLKNCTWNSTILELLRNEASERRKSDIGLRERTTSVKEFKFWQERIEQSDAEIKIITLLMEYIDKIPAGARDTPTSKVGATGTRKSTAAATDGPTAEASTSNVD